MVNTDEHNTTVDLIILRTITPKRAWIGDSNLDEQCLKEHWWPRFASQRPIAFIMQKTNRYRMKRAKNETQLCGRKRSIARRCICLFLTIYRAIGIVVNISALRTTSWKIKLLDMHRKGNKGKIILFKNMYRIRIRFVDIC